MTNPNDHTKAQAAMLKFGRAMPTPEQLARVTTAARGRGEGTVYERAAGGFSTPQDEACPTCKGTGAEVGQ